MAKAEIIRGSQVRGLINSFLFNSKEKKFTKQQIKDALADKLAKLFDGLEPAKAEKSFVNLLDNMARAKQINKDHVDGAPVYSFLNTSSKQEKVAPDVAHINRRVGQQIRSIKSKINRNIICDKAELQLLQDYEAGKPVKPLGKATRPKKKATNTLEPAVVAITAPAVQKAYEQFPVPGQHHPQAGAVPTAQPGGIDLIMYTSNGAVLRMTANCEAQVDALLAAVKKHQF